MHRERPIPEPTIEDYKAENARLKRELAVLREAVLPGATGQQFRTTRSISPYVLEQARINIMEREREALLFGALKSIASRLSPRKQFLITMQYEEEQLRPVRYDPNPRAEDLLLHIDGHIYETKR